MSLSKSVLLKKSIEDLRLLIAEEFDVSTIPAELCATKASLSDIYLKLSANGGDDSFLIDNKDVPTVEVKKSSVGTKRRQRKRDLMIQFQVTIHDNSPTETIEDDDDVRVRFVGWGNDEVGHHSTRVVFDTITHVHEGALRNLRSLTYRKTSTKKGSSEVSYSEPLPRFGITYHDGITQDEVESIKKSQDIASFS